MWKRTAEKTINTVFSAEDNYPQNRITDHRIGYTSMNLDRVMDGDMEDLIEALINEDQKKKLEGSI